MKNNIHPIQHEIQASCACGKKYDIRSTLKSPITLEVCSACHPFYTGKQKVIDTEGRVDRFKRKYGNISLS